MTPLFRTGLAVLAVLGIGSVVVFSSAIAPDVTAALLSDKVTMVTRDNAGMTAAMRMGHETLPELLKLLEQDVDVPLAASVKLRFEGNGETEFIWAQISGRTPTGWVATLQSAPILIDGQVGKGSRVQVDPARVVDWNFQSERTSYRGDFTECYLALQEKIPRFVALLEGHPEKCVWAEAYRKTHTPLAEQIPR